MTSGRVVLPRKRSSSHWDHTAHSETDPHKLGTLPDEYAALATKAVTQKAGTHAARILAMLGLTEGHGND